MREVFKIAGEEETRLGRLSDVPDRSRASLQWGALKVVTSGMRAGYLRKNGVPYSANTVFTEYWDLVPGPASSQWLVVTNTVDDPVVSAIEMITPSPSVAMARVWPFSRRVGRPTTQASAPTAAQAAGIDSQAGTPQRAARIALA